MRRVREGTREIKRMDLENISQRFSSKRIKNKEKASCSRKSHLTSVFGEGCCVTKLTKAEMSGVLHCMMGL